MEDFDVVSANEIFADNNTKNSSLFSMSSKIVGLFLFVWFRIVTSHLEQGKLPNHGAIKLISKSMRHNPINIYKHTRTNFQTLNGNITSP